MWKKLRDAVWEWRGVWMTAPSVTVLIILLRLTGVLQSWEWSVFDRSFHLRPREPADPRIAIVGIDEEDIKHLGQAVIEDEVLADLISKLAAMEPRAIGVDFYRNLPEGRGHEKLVEVYESTPQVIGIQKVVGDRRDAVDPPPELKAKGQVGANDLLVDADERVRRGLVLVADADGNVIPSFSLIMALYYLDDEGINFKFDEAGNFYIGEKKITRFEENDGGYVRADTGGYQTLLNYRGPSRYFETVSMTAVLHDKLPPDWAKDRIILIGKVGESFKDIFFTPYSSGLVSSQSEPMAGVEIHANLTSELLNAVLEDRPLLDTWSEPVEWLWILLWSAVGAVLTWKWRYGSGAKASIERTIGGIVAIVALIGSGYWAFLGGLWIPIVPPVLAMLGSALSITAYVARSAGDIRNTFGRYLSDEIVANLLENPEGLSMGGEKRKITLLTSDLRGFTATSERLEPEDVIKILNHYLEYMADAITSFNGTIDEFMGDGILVLFGAPTARVDDGKRAVACAIAMQKAMVPVNKQMREWGLPPLEMGIGINTGEVVVGNIGSEKRTKYGVVGSQVNLTYRIESYTLGGQIIISEQTLHEAGGESIVKIIGQKQVQPKGVKEPITIYEVGGIGAEYNLSLTKEEEVYLPLTEEMRLQYVTLDGKHVGNKAIGAKIIQLSAKGAEIGPVVTAVPVVENGAPRQVVPPALTNIKMNLLGQETPTGISEDIYAKVLEIPEPKNGNFYIRFTAKPPDIAAKLEALYKSLEGKAS